MATAECDSVDQLIRLAAEPPATIGASGKFWLDGNVIFCACPDCRAPMSVRIWLLLADCWRCGASIELTEDEEREVKRLLDEHLPEKRDEQGPPPPVQPAAAAAVEIPAVPQARAGETPTLQSADPWLQHLLNDTPAWLISLLVHLIVFTLLGLLTAKDERTPRGQFITLTTA